MDKLSFDHQKLEMAAGKLRAISHPSRIAILEMLNDCPMCVTEIFEKLGIDQATASHHLNILKDKGILIAERRGRKIIYSLKHQTISEIINCINRCHD